MASDDRVPARFVVEGAEYPVIVSVRAARGVWSPRRASTADVEEEYADEAIQLIGGSLPATVIDKTGDLHYAVGQVVVGEFTVEGKFRHLQLV
jgi:hypothetical protein